MARILWGFDFGHRTAKPGLCNEAIATGVKSAWPLDVILAQDGNGRGTHGLGQALRDQEVRVDFQVRESRKGPHAYLGTREVAEEFLKFQPLWPEDEVWIACHQASWVGTNAICKGLGVNGKRLLWRNIPYDPDSHQFVARGVIQCWLYKFYSLAGYIWRGEIFGVFRKSG